MFLLLSIKSPFRTGRKTIFSVLRKTKKLNLPIDIQLQMFDCMIVLILLYGSEFYGYEKSDIIESLFLQFYRIIMSFKKNTPNGILYGELGRYPVEIWIQSHIIGFGKRLVCGKLDTYQSTIYLSYSNAPKIISAWLKFVINSNRDELYILDYPRSSILDKIYKQLCAPYALYA